MEKLIQSQNKRIKAHLQKGRSLTAIEALHYFNCFRLSGRVYDLKQQGLNIKSEMIEITSDGKTKRVAKYTVVK
jgi:hypothetical protein